MFKYRKKDFGYLVIIAHDFHLGNNFCNNAIKSTYVLQYIDWLYVPCKCS